MIIIQAVNTTPHNIQSGIATKVTGKTIPSIVNNTNDVCICDYECEYEGTVFAEVGGEDYKNDKKEFLFRRLISSDSVAIMLFKNGIKIADLNDDTYGTFFNGFPNGNSEQQLYVGYLLSWEEVYNLHGGGKYQIKADLQITGQNSTRESIKYNLMGYSDLAADRTVVINSVQNGNILRSDFDFTDLMWEQYSRFPGIFFEDSESFEKNAYLTQDYRQKQIQDKIIENWTLTCDFIPRTVSENITKNALLSNQILITDYNILNEKILRQVSVYPESIEKTRFSDNTKSNYSIKFTSKDDNIIKRNF